MTSPVRDRNRVASRALALASGIFVAFTSSAAPGGDPAPSPGFGLKFRLGYGYGGNRLGAGPEGGYPYYSGPGYPHEPPPLRRLGRIVPFAYSGNPGLTCDGRSARCTDAPERDSAPASSGSNPSSSSAPGIRRHLSRVRPSGGRWRSRLPTRNRRPPPRWSSPGSPTRPRPTPSSSPPSSRS